MWNQAVNYRQRGLLNSPFILYNRISQNVQNIRQNHILQHESHETLFREINSRRTNSNRYENTDGNLHENSLSPLLFKISMMSVNYIFRNCSVRWGSRIYRLNLRRKVSYPQWMSWYETTDSDGEVPVMLELWGMRTIAPRSTLARNGNTW